nr:MAG TPA: hypothetical protein [Caudoviricetes sp.]DAY73224.1 MAG TPA: hypothetical protein [Caudoviricetes sp.]
MSLRLDDLDFSKLTESIYTSKSRLISIKIFY